MYTTFSETQRQPEYGVVAWHTDSRYQRSEAVKLYQRASAARDYANKLNADPIAYGKSERGYVVRTF